MIVTPTEERSQVPACASQLTVLLQDATAPSVPPPNRTIPREVEPLKLCALCKRHIYRRATFLVRLLQDRILHRLWRHAVVRAVLHALECEVFPAIFVNSLARFAQRFDGPLRRMTTFLVHHCDHLCGLQARKVVVKHRAVTKRSKLCCHGPSVRATKVALEYLVILEWCLE